MEIWDAYDENGNLIEDIKLIRDREIPDGLYHMVVEIIVRHLDGDYLLMRRDLEKSRGGLWEISAGGSGLAGESPLQAAKRELFEETGIKAEELKFLESLVFPDKQSIYFEFFCETDWDKDKIILQKGETIDFKWLSKDELLALDKKEFASLRFFDYL